MKRATYLAPKPAKTHQSESLQQGNIMATLTVPNSTNLLNAHTAPHLLDNLLHDRVDLLEGVSPTGSRSRQPLHNIKSLRWVQADWIALEQIGHHDKVAIGGELVRDELGVDEFVADYVGKDEDCGVGLFGFGVGDVGVDCKE